MPNKNEGFSTSNASNPDEEIEGTIEMSQDLIDIAEDRKDSGLEGRPTDPAQIKLNKDKGMTPEELAQRNKTDEELKTLAPAGTEKRTRRPEEISESLKSLDSEINIAEKQGNVVSILEAKERLRAIQSEALTVEAQKKIQKLMNDADANEKRIKKRQDTEVGQNIKKMRDDIGKMKNTG